jgi:hypothetical protein
MMGIEMTWRLPRSIADSAIGYIMDVDQDTVIIAAMSNASMIREAYRNATRDQDRSNMSQSFCILNLDFCLLVSFRHPLLLVYDHQQNVQRWYVLNDFPVLV